MYTLPFGSAFLFSGRYLLAYIIIYNYSLVISLLLCVGFVARWQSSQVTLQKILQYCGGCCVRARCDIVIVGEGLPLPFVIG